MVLGIVVILNVNGLYLQAPRLPKWIFKKNPNICCFKRVCHPPKKETYPKYKDMFKFKGKEHYASEIILEKDKYIFTHMRNLMSTLI